MKYMDDTMIFKRIEEAKEIKEIKNPVSQFVSKEKKLTFVSSYRER